MWCLLRLVWPCSERSCTQNEKTIPNPVDRDRSYAGLCALPGIGSCTSGCLAGRSLPHHLLPRAVGMDRVSTVLHQFRGVDSISDAVQSIYGECGKVGCHWNR